MSFANGLKRIASGVNLGLRIFKRSVGLKSTCTPGTLKQNNIILNSLLISKSENLCYSFPQSDVVGINKKIIDPWKGIKINFELPIRSSTDKAIDLPFYIENEIKEPTNNSITEKRAGMHITRIRRKKIRKHKYKKFLKRNKTKIEMKTLRKKQRKEAALQLSINNIIHESHTFSAEEYVKETLEKYHWKRPITRVKGYLAPKWVVDKYLEEKAYKDKIKERIKECLK